MLGQSNSIRNYRENNTSRRDVIHYKLTTHNKSLN